MSAIRVVHMPRRLFNSSTILERRVKVFSSFAFLLSHKRYRSIRNGSYSLPMSILLHRHDDALDNQMDWMNWLGIWIEVRHNMNQRNRESLASTHLYPYLYTPTFFNSHRPRRGMSHLDQTRHQSDLESTHPCISFLGVSCCLSAAVLTRAPRFA